MAKLDELVGSKFRNYDVGPKMSETERFTLFSAAEDMTGRKVGIKFANSHSGVKGLEREARILGALPDHRNILDLYIASMETDYPFIVMRYCDSSLDQLLVDGKRITPAKAVDYAKQMLSGLSAAHSNGVVHGNLHPSNVLIDNDVLKLRGFLGSDAETAELGETGFNYASPEQRDRRPVTVKSDLHQVGQLLYEMLTGIRFADRSSDDKFNAPEWLKEVVSKATARQEKNAYKSADEMQHDLETELNGSFDEPGFFEKASGAFSKLLHGAGKVGFSALKICAYAALAPVAWPYYLADAAEKSGHRTLNNAFGYFGIFYNIGMLIAAPFVINAALEKTTLNKFVQYAQEHPDMHLGYINFTDDFVMMRLGEATKDDPEKKVFHLGAHSEPERLIGVADDNLFWQYKKSNKADSSAAMQICSLDLSTREIRELLDLSHHPTAMLSWKKIYIVEKDGEKPYLAANSDSRWFRLSDHGRFVLVEENPNTEAAESPESVYGVLPANVGHDMMAMLPESRLAVLAGCGFGDEIALHDGYGGGWDNERFKGKNPIMFEHRERIPMKPELYARIPEKDKKDFVPMVFLP